MQVIAYRQNGDTSNIERVFLYKDSGATAGTEGDPITGLTNASSGLNISTIANNEATANIDTSAATSSIETIATLGTYATPTSGFVRFKEVDATNMPGLYELQWEDARYAVASAIWLDVCISGVADLAPFHGRIYTNPLVSSLSAGAITNASLAGNMEIVFETDFATNYNTTDNGWVTNGTSFIGTGWNTGKTGYSLTATTGLGNQTANLTGNVSGSVGSVTGAVGSVTGAVGSVTGAVGSVAGNVDGNVTGSVGSNLELGPAEVNTEVDNSMVTYGLDHLVSAAVTGTDVTDNSIIAKLVSKSATADWDDFVNTTDALQAIRDHIADGTNLTEAGGTGDHLTALSTAANLATLTTTVGTAGAGLTDLGGMSTSMKAEVNAECDTAMTDYDAATGTELAATEAKVDIIDSNVDNLNLGIIYGAAATGTLSTTQASSDLTGYTNDQLIGRIITVTSGVAEGESSDITDYVETNGVLTFTAMTLAMGNADTFKIT